MADKSKDKFFWADPMNQTAFPVAKAGYPFIYASAFVTIVFSLIGLFIIDTKKIIHLTLCPQTRYARRGAQFPLRANFGVVK